MMLKTMSTFVKTAENLKLCIRESERVNPVLKAKLHTMNVYEISISLILVYGGVIRTRPDSAIRDCGRVPRNLVVFTIKYTADSSAVQSSHAFIKAVGQFLNSLFFYSRNV